MDELVPCYSSRVKGRADTWQRLLKADPYLEGKTVAEPLAVPDLPNGQGFDAQDVWAAYAKGRPHIAPTAAQDAAAVIICNRDAIVPATAEACGQTVKGADAALRELCQALASWDKGAGAADLSADALVVGAYLDGGGLEVPRDYGVIPSQALRALMAASSQ